MYESGDSDVTDYEAYGAHGGESGKSESNNDDEDLYDIEGTDLYVDGMFFELFLLKWFGKQLFFALLVSILSLCYLRVC